MPIMPAELIKPNGFQQTDSPHILKPTFGSVGSQYVRFHIHEEYSGSDSVAQGKEVKRQIELCEIQNDRFTRCPIRVSDLSPKQQVDLAPLYERFKSQKESNETAVTEWDAATDMEKGFLLQCGVFTVEQLEQYEETQIHRLGPSGKDLKERAARHVRTKNGDKKDDRSEEIKLLMSENAKMAERMRILEEREYARASVESEKLPIKKKGPGRWPKKEVEPTPQ